MGVPGGTPGSPAGLVGKWTSIPLWAIGGALLGYGLYLHHEHREANVSAIVTPAGGMVSIRW